MAARMIIPRLVFLKKYQRKYQNPQSQKDDEDPVFGDEDSLPHQGAGKNLGKGNDLADRPEDPAHQVRYGNGKSKSQHQGVKGILAIERFDQIGFRHPADQAHDDNGACQAEPEIPEQGNDDKGGKGPQHVKRAMGEVHYIQQAENNGQPAGHQDVNRPQGQAEEHLVDDQSGGEFHDRSLRVRRLGEFPKPLSLSLICPEV